MEKYLTVGEAIDDFAQNIFPLLFLDGRKGNNNYYRVKNLLYAREAEKAGRVPRRRVTSEWAQRILLEFSPGRYEFREVVVVHDGQ